MAILLIKKYFIKNLSKIDQYFPIRWEYAYIYLLSVDNLTPILLKITAIFYITSILIKAATYSHDFQISYNLS